jgi:hypothetical protein
VRHGSVGRLETALDARARARAAADEWKQRHPKENLPKPIVEIAIGSSGR